MVNKNTITRRSFVGTAVAGAATLSMIPGFAMTADNGIAKIRLGYIGVGIQSHSLLLS